MFKIVLAEILELAERLNQVNRLTLNYTNCYYKQIVNQTKFKICGVVRQNYDKFEGSGQIVISKNNNKFIYFGSWVNSEFTAYYLISDMVSINNYNLIFNGNNYPITYKNDIITHYSLKLCNYYLNIPLVHGANLNLELIDGTSFLVDINNAKPQEQFTLTVQLLDYNFLVNSLYLRSVYDLFTKTYQLEIYVLYNKVSYTLLDLNSNIINKIDYTLTITIAQFLALFLRLPAQPARLDEVTSHLKRLNIIN